MLNDRDDGWYDDVLSSDDVVHVKVADCDGERDCQAALLDAVGATGGSAGDTWPWIDAVVGPYGASATAATVPLSSYYNAPQIAYSASGPLSNDPYFFRVCAPDTRKADAMVQMLEFFGRMGGWGWGGHREPNWRVGIVQSGTDFARGFTSQFKSKWKLANGGRTTVSGLVTITADELGASGVLGADRCRADMCGDYGSDCCAPGGEPRSCKKDGYMVTPGGTTSYGPCVQRFGKDAVYQCCNPALSPAELDLEVENTASQSARKLEELIDGSGARMIVVSANAEDTLSILQIADRAVSKATVIGPSGRSCCGQPRIHLRCPGASTIISGRIEGTCCSTECPVGRTECYCYDCDTDEDESWTSKMVCAGGGDLSPVAWLVIDPNTLEDSIADLQRIRTGVFGYAETPPSGNLSLMYQAAYEAAGEAVDSIRAPLYTGVGEVFTWPLPGPSPPPPAVSLPAMVDRDVSLLCNPAAAGARSPGADLDLLRRATSARLIRMAGTHTTLWLPSRGRTATPWPTSPPLSPMGALRS